MNEKELDTDSLEEMLRYGARELFAEEKPDEETAARLTYDEEKLNQLLDRDRPEYQPQEEPDGEDQNGGSVLGSFNIANVWKDASEAEPLNAKDKKEAKFWEDLIEKRHREALSQKEQEVMLPLTLLSGGKRRGLTASSRRFVSSL